MQRDVKCTSPRMLVRQDLEFSWALIGRCKSESVRVFQRIFAEIDAGSPRPTVCAGLNRSESKVVFNLSAVREQSFVLTM